MLEHLIFDRKAADIKAGDTPFTPTWEQGTLGMRGQNASSSTRVRFANYVQFSASGGLVAIYVPEGWKLGGRRYTSASSADYDQTFPTGAFIRGSYLLEMPSGKYYRFLLAREDDSAVTPSAAAKSGVTFTLFNVKGRYNCTDLNRVGEAINSISARLYADGYGEARTVKADWTVDSDMRRGDLNDILNGLRAVRAQISVFGDTPEVPESFRFLTFTAANDIERILYDMDLLMDNMEAVRLYAGDLYSGEA